jgi:dihydrolipoamide dehydrogenase
MESENLQVDVAVIGAGTAGANAMKEIKRAGKSFVLIDHGPLGTTCARVGCMPSKAVLHAGAVWQGMSGMLSDPPSGDFTPESLWHAARATRDMLASGAKGRIVDAAGEHLLMGTARFVGADAVEVDGRRVTAEAFVIATGSRPIVPGFLEEVRDRVLTTDTLFELDKLPGSIGILGLGAIGLEIGLALSRLGVRVVAGDIKRTPAGIVDPEIAARALAYFGKSPNLTMWLGKPMQVSRTQYGVAVSNGVDTEEVEWILAALGRTPSVAELRLGAAGVALDAHGMPDIDLQTMRADASRVYFAGDVIADRPLMHEAADEGAIAGWNAARHSSPVRFRRRVPLSIVFSDPDLATVGAAFDQLPAQDTVIGTAAGTANGRARILGAEHNLVRIYAERHTGKLLGAGIFGQQGEHLAHLLAWAVQRGETAQELLEMPFYHPSIEEMVQSALTDIVREIGSTQTGPSGLRLLAAPEEEESPQTRRS